MAEEDIHEDEQHIDPAADAGDPKPAPEGGTGGNDDWRAALPDDLRENPALSNFKDLPGLVKSYISTKSLVGKKTTALPSENSGADEWRAFFAAGGCPEKEDGYQVTRAVPEELQDAEGMTAFKKIAWENGVSQKAFAALAAEFDRQINGYQDKSRTASEQAEAARKNELAKMFGRDVDGAMARIGTALDQLDPDKAVPRELLGNLGVVRMLDAVSKRVLGDSLHGKPGADSLVDLEQQAAELRNNPAFANELNTDHDNVMLRYRTLMQQISSKRHK